ncbi:uncharacterized protein [Amphiura filiformis]|uniref:uncharacterized protein n=1 Tax=Amphiura filiformis TaxID=82378 RepID=UPI003B219D3F
MPLVGGYPRVIILIVLSIALCCATGMFKFQQESRTEKLWTPVGSPALKHQEFVEEKFPSEIRFAIYTVEADNVLTTEVLQKMLALHEGVVNITVDENDWNSVCYRLGPNCLSSSILELWSFNSTIISNLTAEDILDKVNEANLIRPDLDCLVSNLLELWSFNSAIIDNLITDDILEKVNETDLIRIGSDCLGSYVQSRLGEIRKDGSNRITGAKATQMIFIIQDQKVFDTASGKYVDEISKSWEKKFIDVPDAHNTTGFTLYKFTKTSTVYLSLAGILAVGLSILSAMGLASAFGLVYGPVHSILPFLLLVTSVTDFCAFLIGSTTVLPALRSFCIYCGIGIMFLFFYGITFFLAWLVIDRKRYERRYDACCCCFRHIEEYEPSKCGQRALLQEFFYTYYSQALLNIHVKVIVLVITFCLFGVCLWGTVTWEQNFDLKWFLPADGDTRAYFTATEKYFPTNGVGTAIYLDEVDYYNERDKMDALYQNFMNSVWIQSSSVSSWYESYESWLSIAKADDPDLNADMWPKNETVLYDWLDEFLASPYGFRFSNNILFNEDESSNDKIIVSLITASHVLFDNSVEEVSGMDNVRGIAREANFAAGEDAAFGYSEVYLAFEANKVIQHELFRNLGLASACVFIVVLVLLANILQTVLVFCCVIFTLRVNPGANSGPEQHNHHHYNYESQPPHSPQHFPIHRTIFMDEKYKYKSSVMGNRINASYRSQSPPNIRNHVPHVKKGSTARSATYQNGHL